MHQPAWHELDDFDEEFDGGRVGLKSALSQGEALLWSARPGLPRVRKIALIPALFVLMLTSLSGVCLSAMLGIFEQPVAGAMVWITALCLPPAVLGGLIAFDLTVRTIAWLAARRRLARTIYAVTDQRAIIARVGKPADGLQLFSFLPGMIEGTRRFEHPDGSGDVYFEGLGRPADELVGFLGVQAVRRVDELIRETLIDPFLRW